MRVLLPCLLLTACSASSLGSAIGLVGLLAGLWILLPRAASGQADRDQGAAPDMATADAGLDEGLDSPDTGPCLSVVAPTAEVCLCIATPGAHLPERVAIPGFDPLAIRSRVLAALPADVRARLED